MFGEEVFLSLDNRIVCRKETCRNAALSRLLVRKLCEWKWTRDYTFRYLPTRSTIDHSATLKEIHKRINDHIRSRRERESSRRFAKLLDPFEHFSRRLIIQCWVELRRQASMLFFNYHKFALSLPGNCISLSVRPSNCSTISYIKGGSGWDRALRHSINPHSSAFNCFCYVTSRAKRAFNSSSLSLPFIHTQARCINMKPSCVGWAHNFAEGRKITPRTCVTPSPSRSSYVLNTHTDKPAHNWKKSSLYSTFTSPLIVFGSPRVQLRSLPLGFSHFYSHFLAARTRHNSWSGGEKEFFFEQPGYVSQSLRQGDSVKLWSEERGSKSLFFRRLNDSPGEDNEKINSTFAR